MILFETIMIVDLSYNQDRTAIIILKVKKEGNYTAFLFCFYANVYVAGSGGERGASTKVNSLNSFSRIAIRELVNVLSPSNPFLNLCFLLQIFYFLDFSGEQRT